jgi:hypothetical protein
MHETCPYSAQPFQARWREAVSRVPAADVDPTTAPRFRFDRSTVTASAGSCFAQHLRHHLVRRGYTYLVTEPEPEGLSHARRFAGQYGLFPARFGNVYTTVQLHQLFERAFDRFAPYEDHWVERGRFFDPYRPHIEPGGFVSVEALRADRAAHLAATRRMFEASELFVFTLGLTEAWRSRRDGAVFPVCPGCGVGTFDPARHEFVNFSAAETVASLTALITGLADINPRARTILTVSPVPLAATMTDRHVIEATVYSKSVLRVAAEEMRQRFGQVDYFPAYEIVTATGRAGEFFAEDRRNVTPDGVARVMDLFFHRYADEPLPRRTANDPPATTDDIVCDEEQALRALDHFAD